jgi:hypothetical protein
MPNFEDTEAAFAYKSNGALRKSYYIFQFFQFNTLVDWGGRFAQLALKFHLPVGIVAKPTIYGQFVGGVTLRETERTVNNLAKSDKTDSVFNMQMRIVCVNICPCIFLMVFSMFRPLSSLLVFPPPVLPLR